MIKYKYNFDPLLQLCILKIIFWHLGIRSDIRRWIVTEWTLSYENIMIIEHVGQEDRNITGSSSLQLTESSSRIIIIVSIASSRILQLIDIFWFKYGIIFFLAQHTYNWNPPEADNSVMDCYYILQRIGKVEG